MRESFDPVKKIHDIGGTSADFIAERNDGERPLVLCACVCTKEERGKDERVQSDSLATSCAECALNQPDV